MARLAFRLLALALIQLRDTVTIDGTTLTFGSDVDAAGLVAAH